MSYKHYSTRNAVQQVSDLHSMVKQMNDELARARKDCSHSRYQVIEAEKRQAFRNALAETSEAVRKLKFELIEASEKQEAEMLLKHSANPYIQLISSGAILTADELSVVIKQNPDNPLLLRSIKNYVNDRKIDSPNLMHVLRSAEAALTPDFSRQRAVDTLVSYLTNYAPQDTTFANPDESNRLSQMFATINNSENNLFEKLDNSI